MPLSVQAAQHLLGQRGLKASFAISCIDLERAVEIAEQTEV
jgi:hypothetical protein